MAEHWCQEHETAFFKKGAMKGYAHPIKNEVGETTGWCNEDKPIHTVEKVAKEMAESKPQPTQRGRADSVMSKTDWSEKDRITRKSIERQTALKEANIRVPAGESSGKVIATAKLFEAYLEGNYLVDEAKKLLKGEG